MTSENQQFLDSLLEDINNVHDVSSDKGFKYLPHPPDGNPSEQVNPKAKFVVAITRSSDLKANCNDDNSLDSLLEMLQSPRIEIASKKVFSASSASSNSVYESNTSFNNPASNKTYSSSNQSYTTYDSSNSNNQTNNKVQSFNNPLPSSYTDPSEAQSYGNNSVDEDPLLLALLSSIDSPAKSTSSTNNNNNNNFSGGNNITSSTSSASTTHDIKVLIPPSTASSYSSIGNRLGDAISSPLKSNSTKNNTSSVNTSNITTTSSSSKSTLSAYSNSANNNSGNNLTGAAKSR